MIATSPWTTWLTKLGACRDAVQWAQAYPTCAEAWTACPRGDWMLWLVGRTLGRQPESAGRRRLVACACQCARLALPYVPVGEMRPLQAIEMAERWASGDPTVTLVMVQSAAAYAADAAADAADDAAYAAAVAAAYAADAADAAADAAAAAADAAAAAADAAAADAAAAVGAADAAADADADAAADAERRGSEAAYQFLADLLTEYDRITGRSSSQRKISEADWAALRLADRVR
jgi:hypothetical protein